MVVCTVASRNRLAGARVLADSLREHHPEARLKTVVVDDVERETGPGEPFDVLHPDDVGLDRREIARRVTMYGPAEFAWSLKAPTIRHLIDKTGGPVVYMDTDCVVYGDLSPLLDATLDHGLALTAHSLTPAPAKGLWAIETFFQRHGVFNSGVMAVSPAGRPFLDWWADRTARYCEVDPERGLTGDQGWLTLVPALFDYTLVRDPGINVMGWSLHDRDVEWVDHGPTLAGAPLRCFHFAGPFDVRRPDDFRPIPERQDPWPPLSERPGTARLCREYAERTIARGHVECLRLPYGYAHMSDGVAIDRIARTVYRDALLAAEADAAAEPPNPFTDGPDRFLGWLQECPDGGPVGRYLLAVRARRDDLVAAFPAVPGDDEPEYLRWTGEAFARGEIDVPWLRAATV